jgi:hypothetical protein
MSVEKNAVRNYGLWSMRHHGKQKEKEKTYLKENKNFEKILKEIVLKKGII